MDQIKDLLNQLKKQSNRPDLHNSLGGLYQQKGDKGEAVKHFMAAARLFSLPDSPYRNLNKAMAILRKVMRDYPSQQDSYYLLAEILEEMDNQEEAVEVYSELSDNYRDEGKHLMAVSVYDKVISVDPDDQEKWIKFASLNSDAGMPFHAAQAYVHAASLGLEKNSGEIAADLVLKALSLDWENQEALEMFRTLNGLGQTEPVHQTRILELAKEVDRSGQYEQALLLLDLLKGTALKDEAEKTADQIRLHSGFEETLDLDGERDQSSAPGKFAGMKVLVVDDEREIVLLLEQILSSEGFQVFTAMDGQEGLGVYMKEKPPLVVTDAMMPKIHGFELCRRIKEESDNTAKVLILTAVYKKYKYKGKVQEEYNVDEYLDKPFQITEFLEVITRMAQHAREAPKYLSTKVPEIEEVTSEKLSMLLVFDTDADLLEKVSKYCQQKEVELVVARDSAQLVGNLVERIPDIIMVTDAIPGFDSSAIARVLKGFIDLRKTTLVLVTKDRSKLEGGGIGDFDHRVFAPIDRATLDNIVQLHWSSPRMAKRRRKTMTHSEKRIDAIVRSKVARILKSHTQLEEYYSTKVRELEEELENMREELDKRDQV